MLIVEATVFEPIGTRFQALSILGRSYSEKSGRVMISPRWHPPIYYVHSARYCTAMKPIHHSYPS